MNTAVSQANVVQSAEQRTYPSANGGSTPTHSLQLSLELVSRSDSRYKRIRDEHYVANSGCIGRQIHFLIHHQDAVAGIISAASPVYATAVRDNYFGITKQNRHAALDGIVNNAVFRLTVNTKYLAGQVLRAWRTIVPHYWYQMYGRIVYGFETFVVEDGDRNGALYRGDNWTHVGTTAGVAKLRNGIDKPADNWEETVPKLVYCRWRDGFTTPCYPQVPRWVRELPLQKCADRPNDEAWRKDKVTRRKNREYLKESRVR